jgi:hypothetical protein
VNTRPASKLRLPSPVSMLLMKLIRSSHKV